MGSPSAACPAATWRPERASGSAADESLRIRVGNAGAVRLVVNGIDLGAMGESGAVVEWRITRR